MISSSSLTERVYHQIRANLIACRFKPGEKLLIRELCQKFHASLGAVREALARLSSEGLVTIEPQRGFRAAQISISDLRDLMQTRVEIEKICLRLAIEAGDREWESSVVAAYHNLSCSRLLNPHSSLMRDEWAALNEEFHNALASGCNNQWLLRVRKMLFTQCERYRRLSISINPHRDVEKEHKAILNAALKRNATRAIALMTSHILKTQAEIVNSTMIEAAPARLMKSISPRIPLNVPRGSKSRMVRTTQDS